MELHWDDYEATPDERSEVDNWVSNNDSPDVGSIAINSEAVFVHGDDEHISHSVVRSHHNDLSAALSQAVVELRKGL
ncbi:MAG: hypothetical protein ABIZ69_06790 [Ilumatobacteraceae bacterium]